MTPGAGHRLGPYEIQAPLGAGGMGEVWRARDTKLGREVAIKLLPPAFSPDGKRRLRPLDGGSLAYSRGPRTRDAVLLRGFR